MSGETSEGLISIRAIGRGLTVLRAISMGGSKTTADITRRTGLPYPTVCRIVATLIDEGYVEREPARKRYRVTEAVLGLSCGFDPESHLVAVARRHMVEATSQLKWPFVVSTRLGTSMVVRDSTHALTSLTLSHYYPGYAFPILDSAAGRAYLAAVGEDERENCLQAIELVEGADVAHAVALARQPGHFDAIRESGLSMRERNTFTKPVGRNSAIAAAIYNNGTVVGTLGMVFFASAHSMNEAASRYGNAILFRANAISAELSALPEA